MKKINEIFYSLQGEGRNAGRAAVFVRFAGCNLRCPFCDTDFHSFKEMSDNDILQAIRPHPSHFVVFTGGEPSLQLDAPLVGLLHSHGYEIAVETNGTHALPYGIDWVTISPKAVRPVLTRCNELKCIFDGENPIETYGISADYYYLQPCDTGDHKRLLQTTRSCISYIQSHPQWRLSLQTQKLAGFK